MRQLIKSSDQVGEILRGRRRARKIPQRDLAAALDISQERLSRREANAAGLTLERLIALTPLYDVISAWPITGARQDQIHPKKLKLALALLGKSKHYLHLANA